MQYESLLSLIICPTPKVSVQTIGWLTCDFLCAAKQIEKYCNFLFNFNTSVV